MPYEQKLVIITYGCQVLINCVLALILLGYWRRHAASYAAHWAGAWFALAIYHAIAALILLSIGVIPSDDWRRTVLSLISVTAGLIMTAFIIIGAWEMLTASKASRRVIWASMLAAALAAAVAVLATIDSSGQMRILVRVGIMRSLIGGVSFIALAATHASISSKRGLEHRGTFVVGALLYGLNLLHYFAVDVWSLLVWDIDLAYRFLMGPVDLVLQCTMGLGMVLWMLEEDRSRLKGAQEELLHSRKMEAVGQLASGIAHDFNNIMMAVSGGIEVLRAQLLREAKPTRETYEDLDLIENASSRASALTEKLLAFSRKGDRVAAEIDPNEAIRSAQSLLTHLLPTSITIDFDLGSDVPSVRMSPLDLQQIVMNLCINARDAMPDGGRIMVSSRLGMADGRHCVVEVKDSGMGMDETVRQRLFEPFFTTKSAGEGSGLGLSTVHAAVQAAGGQIRVDSESGRGSLFSIRLPGAGALAAAPEAPPPSAAEPAQQRTVMLCEDDEAVRRVLARLLRGRGYTVFEAASADQAEQVMRAQLGGIQALVTDLGIPGLDGADLAEQLLGENPDVKVIFCSGYTWRREELQERFGSDHVFLAKPFPTEVLLTKLEQRLAPS